METRQPDEIQLRLEYAAKKHEAQRIYEKSLRWITKDLAIGLLWLEQRPITLQGRAIRNYIARYKEQHDGN